MRRTRYFDSYQALPRMSWDVRNLYNLWSRSLGRHADGALPANITKFQTSSHSLFKQRWQSKKLLRAYHCDYVPEKKFVRWWLPTRLPDPMARKAKVHNKAAEAAEEEERTKKQKNVNESQKQAAQWARQGTAAVEAKGSSNDAKSKLAPITSLMFTELERRMDVVVFRCCFAHSIHAARQLVVHGKVTLNGLKESNPNTRLNPGDMISVDPTAMTILLPPQQLIAEEKNAKEELKERVMAAAKADEEKGEDQALRDIAAFDDVHASATAAQIKAAKKIDPNNPPFTLRPFAAPFVFIPPYLELSFPTCSAIYLRHPTARPGYSEIPSPYDADGEIFRFGWEWYRKHSMRVDRGWRRPIRECMEKGKSGWAGI